MPTAEPAVPPLLRSRSLKHQQYCVKLFLFFLITKKTIYLQKTSAFELTKKFLTWNRGPPAAAICRRLVVNRSWLEFSAVAADGAFACGTVACKQRIIASENFRSRISLSDLTRHWIVWVSIWSGTYERGVAESASLRRVVDGSGGRRESSSRRRVQQRQWHQRRRRLRYLRIHLLAYWLIRPTTHGRIPFSSMKGYHKTTLHVKVNFGVKQKRKLDLATKMEYNKTDLRGDGNGGFLSVSCGVVSELDGDRLLAARRHRSVQFLNRHLGLVLPIITNKSHSLR